MSGPVAPLGLLTIRRPDGELETFAIYKHYQNGVDYLKTFAESVDWEKLKDNEYKSKTNYTVHLEMVQPRFIDLKEEKYLWEVAIKDIKTNG